MKEVRIGNNLVGKDNPTYVIAEVGINHNEYSHSTKLNEATVKSLSADFN